MGDGVYPKILCAICTMGDIIQLQAYIDMKSVKRNDINDESVTPANGKFSAIVMYHVSLWDI